MKIHNLVCTISAALGILACCLDTNADTNYLYNLRYGAGEEIPIGYTFTSASLSSVITATRSSDGTDCRDQMEVYLFNRSTGVFSNGIIYDTLNGGEWNPNPTLVPGDVILVRERAAYADSVNITISGTPYTGSVSLTVPTGKTYWFPISRNGTIEGDMSFPCSTGPSDGDQLYYLVHQLLNGQEVDSFDTYTWDALNDYWNPSLAHDYWYKGEAAVGDAFAYKNSTGSDITWTTTFSF